MCSIYDCYMESPQWNVNFEDPKSDILMAFDYYDLDMECMSAKLYYDLTKHLLEPLQASKTQPSSPNYGMHLMYMTYFQQQALLYCEDKREGMPWPEERVERVCLDLAQFCMSLEIYKEVPDRMLPGVRLPNGLSKHDYNEMSLLENYVEIVRSTFLDAPNRFEFFLEKSHSQELFPAHDENDPNSTDRYIDRDTVMDVYNLFFFTGYPAALHPNMLPLCLRKERMSLYLDMLQEWSGVFAEYVTHAYLNVIDASLMRTFVMVMSPVCDVASMERWTTDCDLAMATVRQNGVAR